MRGDRIDLSAKQSNYGSGGPDELESIAKKVALDEPIRSVFVYWYKGVQEGSEHSLVKRGIKQHQ